MTTEEEGLELPELEDEEEEQEEEVEEEPEVVVAPAPGVGAPRKPNKKKTNRASSPRGPTEPREDQAHFIWDHLLFEVIRAKGRSPADMVIHITRIEPDPEMHLGSFTGDAVSKGSDEFYSFIANNYHVKSAMRGACLYQCEFRWRGASNFVRRGKLRMPPVEELVQMGLPRAYGVQGAFNAPPGVGAPPYQAPQGGGYGPPPQQQQQQQWQPQYQPHPQQHYAPTAHPYVQAPAPQQPAQPQYQGPPPGYVPQQQLDDARAAGEQVASLREALARAEARAAAAGIAAPPPLPPNQNLQDMVNLLRQLGVIPAGTQVPAGLGAPAAAVVPVAKPTAPATALTAALGELTVALGAIKGLQGVFNEGSRLFGGGQQQEAPADAPLTEETEPPAGLPFDIIPIGSLTLGGQPANYARGKDGNFSLEGFALANPFVIEKGAALLEILVKAAATGMGKPQAEQPAQIEQAPAAEQAPHANGAGTANGSGRGWPSV